MDHAPRPVETESKHDQEIVLTLHLNTVVKIAKVQAPVNENARSRNVPSMVDCLNGLPTENVQQNVDQEHKWEHGHALTPNLNMVVKTAMENSPIQKIVKSSHVQVGV